MLYVVIVMTAFGSLLGVASMTALLIAGRAGWFIVGMAGTLLNIGVLFRAALSL